MQNTPLITFNKYSFYSIFIFSFYQQMEDYERRKMYRVHLKNISEIKNCRTPINYTAYPSRLFNFSLKTTFRKRNMKTLEQSNSQPKLINDQKRKEFRKSCHFFVQQQNFRLSDRIHNACGSIDMKKYETEYEEHKKIMNLHRKIKLNKRVILYKIYDITFRSLTPNLKQTFTIYDMSNSQSEEEQLMKGNIFQLRNTMIRGFRGEKLMLKIAGRSQGVVTIIDAQKMVPIIHRKEIVGTLILEVC